MTDTVIVEINDFSLKIPMWYYPGSDNIIGTDVMTQQGWILDLMERPQKFKNLCDISA